MSHRRDNRRKGKIETLRRKAIRQAKYATLPVAELTA